MHNIKWTGVGYSGAFYGFVFNNPGLPFSGIYGAALHTDSARIDQLFLKIFLQQHVNRQHKVN